VVHLPLIAVHPDPEPQLERQHPRASSVPPGELESPPELAGLSVLVVDDELDARSLVHRLLEDHGALVSMAGNAQDAVSLIESQRFDLMISDIGMPNEDGYALIRRVRLRAAADGGNMPAVALTAYARSEDRIRALRAGYQMHLVKPVEPTELLTVVASLMGRKQ